MNPKENAKKQQRKKLEKGLNLFKDHLDRLTKELEEFNERHEKTREEIKRGGIRRTTGRIV
jgi:molecular chaperone GrpE (heat shock protein)